MSVAFHEPYSRLLLVSRVFVEVESHILPYYRMDLGIPLSL